MERVLVKNVKGGERCRLCGFVDTVRNKGAICFIILRDFSGKIQLTFKGEYCVDFKEDIEKLIDGSVIDVEGEVVKSEKIKMGGVEVIVDSLKILSLAESSPIVEVNGHESNIDLRMDFRWIDLRKDKNILMFKVQTEFVRACRDFLLNKEFLEIHTPKIISVESESGAGVFEVNYFGKKAFLAQSPQFYKQMAMAAGFERIFEIGPIFRAEKSNSRKHATEFSGFDVEVSYIDSFVQIMKLEEEMITYALDCVKNKYGREVKDLFGIDIIVPCKPFPVIDLRELYCEIEKRYGYRVSEDEKGDLTTEGERLCEKLSMDMFGSEFLFVTGYCSKNRAFYHMRDENGNPCGYDLIWKGVEITTGAQREHRYEILKKQAEEKGLNNDVKEYLQFFKYGCPPHGGFGLGIDRITMILFGIGIKESMFLFRGPGRISP